MGPRHRGLTPMGNGVSRSDKTLPPLDLGVARVIWMLVPFGLFRSRHSWNFTRRFQARPCPPQFSAHVRPTTRSPTGPLHSRISRHAFRPSISPPIPSNPVPHFLTPSHHPLLHFSTPHPLTTKSVPPLTPLLRSRGGVRGGTDARTCDFAGGLESQGVEPDSPPVSTGDSPPWSTVKRPLGGDRRDRQGSRRSPA